MFLVFFDRRDCYLDKCIKIDIQDLYNEQVYLFCPRHKYMHLKKTRLEKSLKSIFFSLASLLL